MPNATRRFRALPPLPALVTDLALPVALALVPALGLAAAPTARAEQISSLDGDHDEALISIEERGGVLVLKAATREIPCADVKEVRFPAADREPRPAPARAILVGGDELSGEVVGGDSAAVSVRTGSLGIARVKLESLRALIWNGDPASVLRFRRDLLPLANKQDIVIEKSWGKIEGLLDHIDEKGVTIDSEAFGGLVPVGTDRLLGVLVSLVGSPAAPGKDLKARLELADGSVVTGKLVSYKSSTFTIDTSFAEGATVRAAEVRTLSFLNGSFSYVSDLEPVEKEERPSLVYVTYPYRRDASVVEQGPIRIDGRAYRKGLGVHAYSRLAYDLRGEYRKFRAVAGLTDDARGKPAPGSVRFQVLVDGKPALGPEGLLLLTTDGARPVEVEVAGARKIELVADFGPTGDTLARGAWADAFLVKGK